MTRAEIVTFLTFTACVLGTAQSPTGTIQGTAFDPSGAAIPQVALKIIDTATGREIDQTTNSDGAYSAPYLLPGYYVVEGSAEHFVPVHIDNVTVHAGAVVLVDLNFELAGVRESVEVGTQPPNIDLARHVVDTVITEKEIQRLPLLNRNFLNLSALAPGVSVSPGGFLDPTKTYGYAVVGTDGRLGSGTRIQVDGIDITDNVVGSTMINSSMDVIHEFVVTRSSPDPSAPMTSSGVVSVITRSGTNEFHGRGFFDYFNEALSARPGYNATSVPFRERRAGGTASGSLIRSRLFWLIGAESQDGYKEWQNINPLWPQLNFRQPLDHGIRYLTGRMDWNVTDRARLFWKFQNEGNHLATGTTMPFVDTNWATLYTVGFDLGLPRWTHSYRFGYVNFNNRIESIEPIIGFPTTPQGDPFGLAVGTYYVTPYPSAPQATGQRVIQNSYDGGTLIRNHALRFGARFSAVLGAVSIGPTAPGVLGDYGQSQVQQVIARGGDPKDPYEYPLSYFYIPAGRLWPFYAAGHGFPYGAHSDTRTSCMPRMSSARRAA